MSEVPYVKYNTTSTGDKQVLDRIVVNTGFSWGAFFFSAIYIGLKTKSWKMFWIFAGVNLLADVIAGAVFGEGALGALIVVCAVYGFVSHDIISDSLKSQGYAKE